MVTPKLWGSYNVSQLGKRTGIGRLYSNRQNEYLKPLKKGQK